MARGTSEKRPVDDEQRRKKTIIAKARWRRLLAGMQRYVAKHGGELPADLVEGFRSGDRDAIETLRPLLWCEMYECVVLYGVPEGCAGSIADAVWTRLVGHCDSLRSDSLRPWAWRAASRAAIDWHRRNANRPREVSLESVGLAESPEGPERPLNPISREEEDAVELLMRGSRARELMLELAESARANLIWYLQACLTASQRLALGVPRDEDVAGPEGLSPVKAATKRSHDLRGRARVRRLASELPLWDVSRECEDWMLRYFRDELLGFWEGAAALLKNFVFLVPVDLQGTLYSLISSQGWSEPERAELAGVSLEELKAKRPRVVERIRRLLSYMDAKEGLRLQIENCLREIEHEG